MANDLPAAADAVLGGWQLSTIVRLASGYPYAVYGPGNLGDYGFFVTRPNQVGDPSDVSDRTPENFFNRGAFVEAAPYRIGTAPRYNDKLREEPLRNVDFSLSKRFAMLRRYSLDVRADFLNLFNHPQFGFLSTDVGDDRYGQATGVVTPPRTVQLGLKVTF
jgi:hypothetical protein